MGSALFPEDAASGAISTATAGQVRLSSGRSEVAPRVTGMPAWPRAELISDERRRLRVTQAACAVCHGVIGTIDEICGVGAGAMDEVKRWTPLPVAVAWRTRQAEASAWLAVPARWLGGRSVSDSRVVTTAIPWAARAERRRMASARVTSFSIRLLVIRAPVSA